MALQQSIFAQQQQQEDASSTATPSTSASPFANGSTAPVDGGLGLTTCGNSHTVAQATYWLNNSVEHTPSHSRTSSTPSVSVPSTPATIFAQPIPIRNFKSTPSSSSASKKGDNVLFTSPHEALAAGLLEREEIEASLREELGNRPSGRGPRKTKKDSMDTGEIADGSPSQMAMGCSPVMLQRGPVEHRARTLYGGPLLDIKKEDDDTLFKKGSRKKHITTTSLPIVKRREKAKLACVSCRESKRKCDGGQPCSACRRRKGKDVELTCIYQKPKLKTRLKGEYILARIEAFLPLTILLRFLSTIFSCTSSFRSSSSSSTSRF